ncbi:MAG: FtsQ-type POTRA domain-containing protein [Microbacteriaceae bacterium]
MKRPEGFDPQARQPQPPDKPARTQPHSAAAQKPARSTSLPDAPARAARSIAAPSAARTHRDAQRALRKAARERKRFERGEVKRFTRRSRSRRATIIGGLIVVLALAAVLAIAIFSPILALRTIEIRGTSRVDDARVVEAVSGQLGTPLALIDFTRLEKDLSGFTLIRSYVTETVPPNTLVIHITERKPVGVVQRGDAFDLVDPAGVVVQTLPERPENVPLIVLADDKTEGAAFESLIEVVLALPPKLLAQVDSISASTKDDVSFSLRGGKQSVIWGSVEKSEYKARVLAILVTKYPANKKVEFDVSAPDSVVVNAG